MIARRSTVPMFTALFTLASWHPGSAAAKAASERRVEAPWTLNTAFRLASALESDPKDRGRAQESVVLDLGLVGALDEAVRRAPEVEGWRRGVVYAELAKRMVKAGRAAEARSLLAKAEASRQGTEGWQGSRVDAHIAQAAALLGETEAPRHLAGRLAQEDDTQYTGLDAIAGAEGDAARGDYEAAMGKLAPAENQTSLELMWARTSVYLDLARIQDLDPAKRKATLDVARRAAQKIEEPISRLDSLEAVAEAYRQAGIGGAARETLGEAHDLARRMPDSAALKGPFLAGQARAWARLGDRARAREVLLEAVAAAPHSQNLDRPAIWANIAAGYHAAGEFREADKLLEKALEETEALVNARPRALAGVEVCRALARFDVPASTGVRARLQALITGLKAPW